MNATSKTAKAMRRAHEIRKEAAAKYNCKASEISMGECLKLAWKEIKEGVKVNDKGFVVFANRNWSYSGDKGTWVMVKDGKLTVKYAAKGTVSSAFTAEITEFCKRYGINFKDMYCGQQITVEV